MKLWDESSTPGAATAFAQARLVEARERVAMWGRREQYARDRRLEWEQRVRGYENRLGPDAPKEPVPA
jgi:hypothetical protein